MKALFILLACAWSAGAVAAWTYSDSTDAMTGRKVLVATVASRNELNFSSPYSGAQKAILLLRDHPRRGRDAIITIERGQFLCGVSACSVMVRFDDGKPMRYSVSGTADHTTTALFIGGYERFLTGLKSAKRVRIEVAVYQEGAQTMDFEVSGLNWEARRKGKSAVSKAMGK